MSRPDEKTGKTRLQLLEEILEQTGILAPELANMPAIPHNLTYLWKWFCDLSRSRAVNFSPEPIHWSDLAAYFDLFSLRPSWWELDTIRRLDDCFLESRANKDGAPAARSAAALQAAAKAKPEDKNG